jgi:AraC-like DNA-binding protein
MTNADEIDFGYLEIIRVERGVFGHRHSIGPAEWGHHDLLWIHQGEVELFIGSDRQILRAPDGILIPPATKFHGKSLCALTQASICHFSSETNRTHTFIRPIESHRSSIQAMVELLHRYIGVSGSEGRQLKLLVAILDAVQNIETPSQVDKKLEFAWQFATQNLSQIRTLHDVASAINMSESAFRSRHRKIFGTSAGRFLLDKRMKKAAELLSTSNYTVKEISAFVGYQHVESFIKAFKDFFGCTPGTFRKNRGTFA